MKIAAMQSHIVAVPPPHIGGMYWIFVSLQTHCGIEGVGEVYASTFHPEVMVKVLDDVFHRYLKGHDPHHIERFFSYLACSIDPIRFVMLHSFSPE